MKKTTILITDDHTMLREAWNLILNSNPQFEVIGECGTGEEAIEMARVLRPNVVLMDINLPGMNGISATEQIRKDSPDSKILAISLHSQPVYARKMLRAGAGGYVTKNSAWTEMQTAVFEVSIGHKYICQEVASLLLNEQRNSEGPKARANGLSIREIEIVDLIKNGCSSKEIAANLNISVKTVEVHRYNILKKLGVRNSASLVNLVNGIDL